MIKGTFGSQFSVELDFAKSGYTAPGGRTDGGMHGTDLDAEVTYNATITKPILTDWKERTGYPSTRFRRIVRSIVQDIDDDTPSVLRQSHNTSGW